MLRSEKRDSLSHLYSRLGFDTECNLSTSRILTWLTPTLVVPPSKVSGLLEL